MRAVSAHRAILSDKSIPDAAERAAPGGYLLKGNHSPRRARTFGASAGGGGGGGDWVGAAGVSGHICCYILADGHRSEKYEN